MKREQINERNMVECNEYETKEIKSNRRYTHIRVLELLYIAEKCCQKMEKFRFTQFIPIPTHKIVLSIQIGPNEQSSRRVSEVHYGYCI